MKISAINQTYQKSLPVSRKTNQPKNFLFEEPKPVDSVSFKGGKAAIKGATVLGILGGIVGAIVSGGTSILPTVLYFAGCNAIVGGVAGASMEDDD